MKKHTVRNSVKVYIKQLRIGTNNMIYFFLLLEPYKNGLAQR